MQSEPRHQKLRVPAVYRPPEECPGDGLRGGERYIEGRLRVRKRENHSEP